MIVNVTRGCAGDVRCRLPAIIMPGLELQVTLGQGTGDEPPLAVAVPAGATPAPAPAVAPGSGAGGVDNAAGAAQSEAGAVAVPGFEPTDEQMASFTQVTGAVRSVARGELLSCPALPLHCASHWCYAQGLQPQVVGGVLTFNILVCMRYVLLIGRMQTS